MAIPILKITYYASPNITVHIIIIFYLFTLSTLFLSVKNADQIIAICSQSQPVSLAHVTSRQIWGYTGHQSDALIVNRVLYPNLRHIRLHQEILKNPTQLNDLGEFPFQGRTSRQNHLPCWSHMILVVLTMYWTCDLSLPLTIDCRFLLLFIS